MDKKSENLIFFFLVIFSIYCSLILGMSWDEPYHYDLGKDRLKYLFSLGKYEYISPFFWSSNSPYFPGFYDTLAAFVSQMISRKYEVQIHHLINLFFSFSAVLGIAKISKIIFNKKVSKIVFLVSFLNPVFFGHMSINPKDTIIAFSNIWATYFIIRYLQTQHLDAKRKYFSTLIGLAMGFGVGIRLIFISTLLPIITLAFLDIFLIKAFSKIKFSIFNFFKDFIKIFLIVYFMMIIFWPEVHSNIFVLPFKFIFASLGDVTYGSYWGLINGEFYRTINTPRFYLMINLFYKLPEYILFTYIIFIISIFRNPKFFEAHFKLFNIKILYIIFIILFPIIITFITSLKIHDGLRYFLFLIPYLSIIPSILIYYLTYNSKILTNKLFSVILFVSFLYHLFVFFSLTPYQYTYLNKFNGNFETSSERFENDYWGVSIKDLTKKIKSNHKFQKDKIYKIAYCGINYAIGDYYLKKIPNFKFVNTSKEDEYDYILMTNRHNGKNTDRPEQVKTCFQTYKGKDVILIKKRGLILSTLRKRK